jgi:hypothetical protein
LGTAADLRSFAFQVALPIADFRPECAAEQNEQACRYDGHDVAQPISPSDSLLADGGRARPEHGNYSACHGARAHLQMWLCKALAWRGDEFGKFPARQ